MDLPVRRIAATGAAMALLLVAIVSMLGDGTPNASAAAATPYGEMIIFKFQGTQKLETDIKDHSWGIKVPGELGGGGGGTGRAELGPLTVTRASSSSSPLLAEAIAKGLLFEKVTVKIFKPGTNQAAQTFTMQDVFITEFKLSPGGSQTETISFQYGEIDWVMGSRTFCWFIPDHTECVT